MIICYYTYDNIAAATELPLNQFRELVRRGFWITLPSGHQTIIGTHFIPPSQIKYCQAVELNGDDKVRLRTHGDYLMYDIPRDGKLERTAAMIESKLKEGRKAYYMRDNLIFLNNPAGLYSLRKHKYQHNSFADQARNETEGFTHICFVGEES